MVRNFGQRWLAAICLCCGVVCAQETTLEPTATVRQQSTESDALGAAFFEKKIRPILVRECYACHSTEKIPKVRAGLALDSKDGLRRGGDSGAAIVPGEPGMSLLLMAIGHSDPELRMPPKKKLDDATLADFEQWVRMGAPDPRTESSGTHPTTDAAPLPQPNKHWAYTRPQHVIAPAVKADSWPRSDIDRFVLNAMEAKGLSPATDADRATLLRRLSFDITGLPPSTAESQRFADDDSEDAFELAIDRLLDSPRFGEKWARHWLDVVRYAESTGKTVNFGYPHAWRYRDYVIAAFNADKPYDLFIKEQLAGDLMPTDNPVVNAERTIATGFLAIGPKTLNERNGLRFELDMVDEQIEVTTQAFLATTAACARCHDHKLDPIPQAEYYALAGIFRSTETCYGTVAFINAQRVASLLPLPSEAHPVVAVEKLTESARQRLEDQLKAVQNSVKTMKDQVQQFFAMGQVSLLRAVLDAYDAEGNPKLLAMGVRDKPSKEFAKDRDRFPGFPGFTYDYSRFIADSPLYARGETDQPSSQLIARGTLRALADEPLSIPANSSGRLQLAEWIASQHNPLTARVMVNRIWRQLFGRGIVPTIDDFGGAGRPPSHPELLDHLAVHFMEQGWSIKRLIKYLVMSRTYQLSSVANMQALEIDPANILLWRNAPRRLDAEVLRDALLAVSGRLETSAPVGSAVAQAGEGPITRPRFGPDPIAMAIADIKQRQRSIYLPIVRDNLPEFLAIFDAADPSLITGDRQQTTVPSQGLFLMNNAFVMQAADSAAESLLHLSQDDQRVHEAFLQFFGRPPNQRERDKSNEFLKAYQAQLEKDAINPLGQTREMWSSFCQALIASAEFQTRK